MRVTRVQSRPKGFSKAVCIESGEYAHVCMAHERTGVRTRDPGSQDNYSGIVNAYLCVPQSGRHLVSQRIDGEVLVEASIVLYSS